MGCFAISNKKRRFSAWSNAQDPAGRQCPAGSCGCAARMQKGDVRNVRKDDEELERTRSASVRTVRCPFQHCHHTIVRTAMQADISTIMNIDTIITKECGDRRSWKAGTLRLFKIKKTLANACLPCYNENLDCLPGNELQRGMRAIHEGYPALSEAVPQAHCAGDAAGRGGDGVRSAAADDHERHFE